MSIQITNDPINQFLDNLPRYALEMRRQDAQREQFDRQQRFREEAFKASEARAGRAETRADLREARAARLEERQKTLFDLVQTKEQYLSDVFKERINTASRMRSAEKVARDFEKNYQTEIKNYKNRFFGRIPAKLGITSGSFEDYIKLQRRGVGGKTRERLDQALNDYQDLKNNYNPNDIKPNEIPIPGNLRFDKSLYDMTIDFNMQPSRTRILNDLYNIYGDDAFKVNDNVLTGLQREQVRAER
tara:strand:+ start:633 stop:1367 length:735 start_codon:yes stop_codon:yes gene_type:complete